MGLLEMLKSLFGMSDDNDGVSNESDTVGDEPAGETNMDAEETADGGEDGVVEGGPVTEPHDDDDDDDTDSHEEDTGEESVSHVEGTKLSADKESDKVSPSGGAGLDEEEMPDDNGLFGEDTEE